VLGKEAEHRENAEEHQRPGEPTGSGAEGEPPPGQDPERHREGRHHRPRRAHQEQPRKEGEGEEGQEARGLGWQGSKHRGAFYAPGEDGRFRVTIGAVTSADNGLRAVLYDWDGTLVDSAEKSYRCYVRVFSEYGIGYSHEQYQETYTPDWYRTYEAVGLPREQWPEADRLWTDCYEKEPSTLLPGAREALERAASGGLSQGLVSSGESSRVRREIQAFSLEGYFGEAVVCGGETERRKPDPEPLVVGLEKLGVAPDEAAYVGDSPEDVTMARAAGVFAVGIPGGFPNREALEASEPDLLAPTIGAAIDRLLRS
jgi:HAD superfamily hydrolase (TIGR01549 family)